MSTEPTPTPTTAITKALVQRAFGAENRAKLFSEYFHASGAPVPADAWQHVYRLLLWIDRTTGLAHCYESDKSQPGRHWYGRSLAFHAWLADQMAIVPADLGGSLDWLFRKAIEEFAKAMAAQKANRVKAALNQRAPYVGKGMPEPGEDPELVVLIKNSLGKFLVGEPAPADWRILTEAVGAHYTQENKRRNLVGEAFEDLVAELIRRLPTTAKLRAETRVPIQDIRGFSKPSATDKEKKIDIVVQRNTPPKRILVTAKWSIRADREEQFASDFDSYTKLENAGEVFDYVLVTNEFDPARLLAACERLSRNSLLFRHVVHVNTNGLLAAYGDQPERSAAKVAAHIAEKRLISLGDWLTILGSG